MRLNLAVTILAGLAVAWGAVAHAAGQSDAPPAAPIFYCPTPGKAAPVAPHHAGCPTAQAAVARHHRHGRTAAPAAVVASNDVSASQAFIYRYERAVHGLDPRAASQAWAAGNGPPAPGPALAQREAPPPACPHGCPGPEAWRHAGPPPMAEQEPPPMALRPPPPPGYAWNGGQSGYAYQESERAGGWSYSEENGRGHYARWGDQLGEPRGRWDGPPRRPCPPTPSGDACAAGQWGPPVDRVAGRDAAGYLTWPGKTPAW